MNKLTGRFSELVKDRWPIREFSRGNIIVVEIKSIKSRVIDNDLSIITLPLRFHLAEKASKKKFIST